MARPRFNPSRCKPTTYGHANVTWTPIITCPADFPASLFEHAISQLIHHPEYNSTLILRSEVIDDSVAEFPNGVPVLEGLQPVRNIHRRLLPRRPTRDAGLEQHCTLYAPTPSSRPTDIDEEDAANSYHVHTHPTALVLTPILPPDGGDLPYYHPTVTHLAFRFVEPTSSSGSGSSSGPAPAPAPALRIDAVPLPGTSLDPGARLYRTCLSLLETLHRYGWGALTNYKKRVAHDVLVPRETYQDAYLLMRERHKHLIDEWREVTDPLKHVFEDIGIATFLMLLWKDTYGPETIPPPDPPVDASADAEPWRRWPRPPGGFVDLGCGNGLLTHILISEGYTGHGFDLRARTSWTHYPPSTQSHLLVRALDPTGSSSSSSSAEAEAEADTLRLLPAGCFLIGNHADELTPWVPILATRFHASGYLSIPCCAWALDARFDRARDVPLCAVDAATLNLGDGSGGGEGGEGGEGEGGGKSSSSSYALYRVWLAALSVHCGLAVEVEMLRIPSTRNWAIVGRKRVGSLDAASHNIEELIESVRKRGQFKTRRPEGKAGDHRF